MATKMLTEAHDIYCIPNVLQLNQVVIAETMKKNLIGLAITRSRKLALCELAVFKEWLRLSFVAVRVVSDDPLAIGDSRS